MFYIKPKKDNNNNQYINISNTTDEKDEILNIDLKTINLENISVELALNVLQLKHSTYNDMKQNDIIQYYNNKIKMTNNINTILALKIILKSKLSVSDVKINKINGISVSNQNTSIEANRISNLVDSKIKTSILKSNNNFKIQQDLPQNNFKIIQNNITSSINKYSTTNNDLENHLKIFNHEIKPIDNNVISNEKIKNLNVINSSEFDIDSIIKSYSHKKNQGFM